MTLGIPRDERPRIHGVIQRISAGLYVFLPSLHHIATLLAAVMLLTTSFLFVASAQNGMTSMIGQEHAMSGQISAVWNIFLSVPTVAFLDGGHLSGLLEHQSTDQAAASYFSSAPRSWPLSPLRRMETQKRVRQRPHQQGPQRIHSRNLKSSRDIGRSIPLC